jgi:hypothetical protein
MVGYFSLIGTLQDLNGQERASRLRAKRRPAQRVSDKPSKRRFGRCPVQRSEPEASEAKILVQEFTKEFIRRRRDIDSF